MIELEGTVIENWEDAILQSIAACGGQTDLQQVYKTISRFVVLTDEHLRETQWSRRPAYQHAIRSYVSNMSKSGELSRIGRGEYRLTEKGRNRLSSVRQPAISPDTGNRPTQRTPYQNSNSSVVMPSKQEIPPTELQVDLSPAEVIESEESIRILRESYHVLRNLNLVQQIKSLYRCQCQLCGETIQLQEGKLYAEVHHLKPLGRPHNGPDVLENMLCVCPNHHVQLDFGAIKLNPKNFKLSLRHKVGENHITYYNTEIYRG